MTFCFTAEDGSYQADLPNSLSVAFFDELARLIEVFTDDDGDDQQLDKAGKADENGFKQDTEESVVVQRSSAMITDAGKERRLRMALTLATCITGPATRYDGLRPPSDEDFWVRPLTSPRSIQLKSVLYSIHGLQDGLKPIMWFHGDPVEVLLIHCVQAWADEQSTGFA
jgi:hypothetical protein